MFHRRRRIPVISIVRQMPEVIFFSDMRYEHASKIKDSGGLQLYEEDPAVLTESTDREKTADKTLQRRKTQVIHENDY